MIHNHSNCQRFLAKAHSSELSTLQILSIYCHSINFTRQNYVKNSFLHYTIRILQLNFEFSFNMIPILCFIFLYLFEIYSKSTILEGYCVVLSIDFEYIINVTATFPPARQPWRYFTSGSRPTLIRIQALLVSKKTPIKSYSKRIESLLEPSYTLPEV